MQKQLKIFCLVGCLFCVILGSVSHFFYTWSGNNALVGFFFPSNESTWEHLKMILFPFGLYFLVGSFFIKNTSFAAAVGFSVSVACMTIITVFYGYTCILQKDVLWIDIVLFLVAVVLGFVTFYFCASKTLSAILRATGYILLGFWYVLYMFATLYAPPTILFTEPSIGA